MTQIEIEARLATKEDLPSIMEIENLCFKAPWKEEDILHEIYENEFASVWVVELFDPNTKQKVVAGYSDYWRTYDSASIVQIAIHPSLQRRQLGSFLMDEIYNDCYAKKVRTITLEVRKSNQKAINFYKKHGFVQLLTKPNYYSNGEDALYMSLEVK